MFFPNRGTPYDLRFSLLGIPVTVSPFFWLVAALLGYELIYVEPGGPANLIAWVLCVFVSILWHEFGHALTMRAFRHDPEVVLYHLGGYARPSHRDTPGRTFLFVAAGPGASFVLGGLTYVLDSWLTTSGRLPERGTPIDIALNSMFSVNIYWGIVNCLPVWPLDGGQMLGSVFEMARLRSAQEWTFKVGLAVGTVAALYFFLNGSQYAGFLFMFLAVQNFQGLQSLRRGPW